MYKYIYIYKYIYVYMCIYAYEYMYMHTKLKKSSELTNDTGDMMNTAIASSTAPDKCQTLRSERSELWRAERADASEASSRMRAVVYLKLLTRQTESHT